MYLLNWKSFFTRLPSLYSHTHGCLLSSFFSRLTSCFCLSVFCPSSMSPHYLFPLSWWRYMLIFYIQGMGGGMIVMMKCLFCSNPSTVVDMCFDMTVSSLLLQCTDDDKDRPFTFFLIFVATTYINPLASINQQTSSSSSDLIDRALLFLSPFLLSSSYSSC